MYKYFNRQIVVAAASSAVMEAVNHFKNSAMEADTISLSKHGRSSTSLKSRGNFLTNEE